MKVIIEIPKGDDRRRHLKFDKTGFVDLGLIRDVIPVNEGIMPVHYGYIPGTTNPQEGDEIDVLILSESDTVVGQEMEVRPVALIRRADGDDKVVAVDETQESLRDWHDVPEETRTLIEEFFSYHHAILSIENAEAARVYVGENLVDHISNK
jgi:inorganic pyrophosphatase